MGRIVPKEVADAYRYLGRAKVSHAFLLISVVLSGLAALVQLYLVRLLFPLVEGIITRNFDVVRSLPILSTLAAAVPRLFSHPPALFLLLAGWVYLMSVTKSGLSYALSILVRREALQVARQIRITILDRYLHFGKLFFDRNDTSELVDKATNCSRWIESLFVGFQLLLSGLLEIAVYLSIMTVVSWQLTVSVLLALPLFRIGDFLLNRIREASKRSGIALTGLQTRLTQLLSFLTLVRTSGQTEHERASFLRLADDEAALSLKVHRMTSLVDPVQEITGTTALLFMALCLSVFVGGGRVASSRLFVFFFLVLRVIPIFNSLGRFRILIAREVASAEAFDSLMTDEDKHIVPSGSRAFPPAFERIEIRNLRFSYNAGTPVLKGLSLAIPAGRVMGLVGPTGAGKTTLVHLLMRFYDCPPGTIFVDGTDIREFDIDSLRSQMSLVSQDAPVLQESIRRNILYSSPRTPSDAEFNAIVEKARLKDFVANLPNGVETIVGERGATLSGGERQRIAIARALLKGANLLVLDEPTSALDPETERLIAEATHELTRGKTTIVIAHRMSTISRADGIAVLVDGAIAQVGPPQTLAADDGPFRRFVGSQVWPESRVSGA